MSEQVYLLWRAFGATWGVLASSVKEVVKGKNLDIRIGDAVLPADEVIGITENIVVHEAGKVLSSFWPYPCSGLAVVRQEPIVVLKPSPLPKVLCKEDL